MFRSVWPYGVVRVGLAIMFLAAGLSKLPGPGTFATVINAFGILPKELAFPIAVTLPLFEVAIGLALILDIRGALSSLTGLLLLFMAVLGYGIWMGFDIDCGCYGPGDPEGEAFSGLRSALYRDLGMLAAALYLYVWRRCTTWKSGRPLKRIRKYLIQNKESAQCTR